jgi:hypothetical protein
VWGRGDVNWAFLHDEPHPQTAILLELNWHFIPGRRVYILYRYRFARSSAPRRASSATLERAFAACVPPFARA